MIILKLNSDRQIAFSGTNEKIYRGDNQISSISVYLPSTINDYPINECTIKSRFYVQKDRYLEYDIETASPYYDLPITTDITYKAQKVGVCFIIYHEGEVVGSTNTIPLEIYESKNGEELPPREDLDNIIAEQRETISNQQTTIDNQAEEIEEKDSQISGLNNQVSTLTTRNQEQAQTITRQNTTIDELNRRVPPLQQLDPINPSDIQQTLNPESPNIGFPQVIVNPVSAEGVGFNPDYYKEDEECLGKVGTYNPFPEGSQGGIYIIEQTSQGYPIKILVKNYSRPLSPFGKCYDDSASGRGALQEFKFEDCENITELASGYFSGCDSLTTVILPTSLKRILNNTFVDCSSLQRIELPNGLQRIEAGYTFSRCTALRYVFLPNTLEYVTDSCFFQLYDLTDIQLENGFNCSINLSHSNKYPVETLVAMLEALADRTGETAYTLTIRTTNLNKLTAEQIAIATNKNWNLT